MRIRSINFEAVSGARAITACFLVIVSFVSIRGGGTVAAADGFIDGKLRGDLRKIDNTDVEGCDGDFDTDGDVDGRDVVQLALDLAQMDLGLFAAEFGHANCLPPNDPLDRWVQTAGPPSGADSRIEIDPSTGAIYTASIGGSLFKSTDGESWSQATVFTERYREIVDIMIDRSVRDRLYVFVAASPDDLETVGEVFKSSDGAQTWSNTGVRHVIAAAISPIVSGALIVGKVDGTVAITENGGDTWVNWALPARPSEVQPPFITNVAAGADGEYWVCPTWTEGQLFHTTDSGTSWQTVPTFPTNQLPEGAKPFDILVDSNDNQRVYVTYTGDVDSPDRVTFIRTDNGGGSWTQIHNDSLHLAFLDPGRDTLYASSGMDMWWTSDHGATWTRLLGDVSGPDTLKYVDPLDIAVDPARPEILYLPTGGFGLAKSTDGGETWRTINKGLRAAEVSLVAVLAEPVGGLIVNGDRQVFRTQDWGQTWQLLDVGSRDVQIDEIVIDPADSQRVWIATDTGEMHTSDDGGDSFTNIFRSMPPSIGFRYGSIYALAHAAVPAPPGEPVQPPDRLYAVKAGFGIWRSDDGGSIWRFLKNNEVDYTYTLAVDPVKPDILFSGHNPKPFQDAVRLFRTRDGGVHWDMPLSLSDATALTSVVIDPNNTSKIYAGATSETGGRLYCSEDGGDYFEIMPGLNFSNIHAMAVHPSDPAFAIAALWGGGIYHTADSGATWQAFIRPPTVSASAVMITPADPPVFHVADRTAPRIYEVLGPGPDPMWTTLFDAGEMYYRVATAAAAPSAPTVIYAAIFDHEGPMSGSLFRIENGVGTDVTGTLPVIPIALAVHPTDPNTVYACLHGAGAGVYKTTDGGGEWALISGEASGIPQSPAIGFNGVVIDADNPQNVYLFGGSDAQLGPDGITSTGADPADLHTVYKSADGGGIWTNLNDGNLGASSGAIKGLAILPHNPSVLFAGALNGVFRSMDSGTTWSRVDQGITYRHLGGIGVSNNGRALYGPTLGGGMFVASVGVNTHVPTWEPDTKLAVPVSHVQVAVSPHAGNTLFASAYPGGVFKSTDEGATWSEQNFGLPTLQVDDPTRQGYYALAISASSPDTLYLGIYRRGVYRSEDGGATWLAKYGANKTLAGAPIASVLVDPFDPDRVYTATENGVFLTTNGGDSWTDFSTGLANPDVRVLALTSTGDLLAGTRGDELYRWDSDAGTWQQMPAFGDLGQPWLVWDRGVYQYTSILFHPVDPNIIYIGTFPAGIYKSTDSGQTWREWNVGFTNDGIFYITFHPDNPNIIYAGTYNGVNVSFDAGEHWQVWDAGWPDEQWVFDIEFDPRDPNVMYACSMNGENKGSGREGFHGTVMKSLNGGDLWSEITTGLSVQEFYGLVVDPQQPDTIYLAGQKGVFVSDNAGASWEAFNEGLTNPMASHPNNVTNPLAISADGKYLFLGSLGSGVYRRRLRP